MSQLAPLLRRAADILEVVGDAGDREAMVTTDSGDDDLSLEIQFGPSADRRAIATVTVCPASAIFIATAKGEATRQTSSLWLPDWFIEFLDKHFPKEEGK